MHRVARQIVISGVSRGLGLAMTSEFIAAGHVVHGCARSAESVARMATRFASPNQFHVVDVCDYAAVQSWADELATAGIVPDLLINNAAIINPNAVVWETSVDDFHAVIETNINGTFHLLRAFLPQMVKRRKGVIVNFSSGWGRSTSPEVGPYCATKYAVEGLTASLAQELPDGMAAVALNPGIIDTDMLRSCFGGNASAYPDPAAWAKRAVPYILGLSARDNGRSASVPGT